MPTVSSVISDFNALSEAQQNIVKSTILSRSAAADLHKYVEERRFINGRACPHCGSVHVVKNGKRKDGTQRYLCRDCEKSFVITANSIAEHSRKPLGTWKQYVNCMLLGLSLRDSAAVCGIHLSTAFLWRHKILDALRTNQDDILLEGVIEADETFFTLSFKGNHKRSTTFKMPRPAHKRGGTRKIRGLSHEKVCVPCAVNRDGQAFGMVSNLARVKTKGLEEVFRNHIKTGSHLVADKASAYQRFAASNGLALTQIKSGRGATPGGYSLARINNYHSELKRFITRFKGVSTKYLNNYLAWHGLVNYSLSKEPNKRQLLLADTFGVPMKKRGADVPRRDPVPLLA